MFGMGGSEIIVILIVALLFLGPDKLPEAAKQISKGIRDIKKQSRNLQQTIENDERIGGAIRDIKSALRGEDEPYKPPAKKKKVEVEVDVAAAALVAKSDDAAKLGDAGAIDSAATAVSPSEPAKASEGAAIAEVNDADKLAAFKAEPLRPRMAAVAGEADADAPVNDDDDDAELAAMIKPVAAVARNAPKPAASIADKLAAAGEDIAKTKAAGDNHG